MARTVPSAIFPTSPQLVWHRYPRCRPTAHASGSTCTQLETFPVWWSATKPWMFQGILAGQPHRRLLRPNFQKEGMSPTTMNRMLQRFSEIGTSFLFSNSRTGLSRRLLSVHWGSLCQYTPRSSWRICSSCVLWWWTFYDVDQRLCSLQ